MQDTLTKKETIDKDTCDKETSVKYSPHMD